MPGAHLQQHRFEDSDLDHLAAHAFDFHPIPNAHAVAADENEPAEKSDDEILEHDSQAGGGEPDDGRHLTGRTEDDEEHGNGSDGADSKRDEEALLVHAAAILLV